MRSWASGVQAPQGSVSGTVGYTNAGSLSETGFGQATESDPETLARHVFESEPATQSNRFERPNRMGMSGQWAMCFDSPAADLWTSRVKNRCFSFWRDTRAGATALSAVLVAIMAVGAGAFITDHLWLFDQRDKLKSANDAASIAAMVEMNEILTEHPDIPDQDLHSAVEAVALRFISASFADLTADRYEQAMETLEIGLEIDRLKGRLTLTSAADLGGHLFSSRLPLLSGVPPLLSVSAGSGVAQSLAPPHIVLALDNSNSMQYTLDGIQVGINDPNSRAYVVREAAKAMIDLLNPTAENRIAIGLVPWDVFVRVQGATKANWMVRGWAEYPQSRHYGAIYSCNNYGDPNACLSREEDQALPFPRPVGWRGCLDEQRVSSVGHAARPPVESLFDHPLDKPFAQAIYPSGFGYSYECMQPPRPSSFFWQWCYGNTNGAISGVSNFGHQAYCGVSGMHPLSADATEIKNTIDNLRFDGNGTYSALGVLWAQRILSHQWADVWDGDVDPIDPSVESVRKIIILLTDGDDNKCGNGDKDCQVNDLGFARNVACTAAKEQGTEIFVIAAIKNLGGSLGRALTRCSSQDDYPSGQYTFLNVSSIEDIREAFATIALQLRTLRRIY